MNVSLTPELERLVAEKVESGMYQTASEVVREGLRLLKRRDEELASLRAEIKKGLDAVERGEYTVVTEANRAEFVENIKREARADRERSRTAKG